MKPESKDESHYEVAWSFCYNGPMRTVLKAFVLRLLGVRSPSLGGDYQFDYMVKEWLGINQLKRRVTDLELEVSLLRERVEFEKVCHEGTA